MRKIDLNLALLALLFLLPNSTVSDCNVCSGLTNTACVSNTQFQTCVGGYPNGPLNSCPAGYVCTANAAICQPNTANVAKACNGCNQCDITNTFACTGPRSFALCLGTAAISSVVGNCESNYVCNVDYPQICGNPSQGIAATCSFLDDSTPTAATPTAQTPTAVPPTSPPPNPTAYCRAIRQCGRFPYGNSLTTSCRQYVYCYKQWLTWYGTLYTCPNGTYYDSALRVCTYAVPPRCSISVRSLQVNNLQLA